MFFVLFLNKKGCLISSPLPSICNGTNMVIFWAFWFGIQKGCFKLKTFLSIWEIGWRHQFSWCLQWIKKSLTTWNYCCWLWRIPLWVNSSTFMLSHTKSWWSLLRVNSNCLVFIHQSLLFLCSYNAPAETTWQLITFKLILQYVFPTDLISLRQFRDLFITSETLHQHVWYVSLYMSEKWERLKFLCLIFCLLNFTLVLRPHTKTQT